MSCGVVYDYLNIFHISLCLFLVVYWCLFIPLDSHASALSTRSAVAPFFLEPEVVLVKQRTLTLDLSEVSHGNILAASFRFIDEAKCKCCWMNQYCADILLTLWSSMVLPTARKTEAEHGASAAACLYSYVHHVLKELGVLSIDRSGLLTLELFHLLSVML